MTKASDYLYSRSRQITEPYTQLPQLRAAMVTGSVAKGVADNYSDIDMTYYYAETLPDEAALNAIRKQLGGTERRWTIGDRAQGSFAEAYGLDGIEVQIGHTTIASWDASIDRVLKELDVKSPTQKALEGTLVCRALYGEALIEQWRARIAAYPPAVAEAMVREHLSFFPVWGLEPHFRSRDATVWFYQALVEATHNIVAVLAGLNRLYFTTFQFKRMGRFLDQMTIKPPDVAERIERMFKTEPAEAARDLERLVAETLALVDEHMPTVSTVTAGQRLGWRQQSWQLPD